MFFTNNVSFCCHHKLINPKTQKRSLFTSCIITYAASKQGCTLSQQPPAALPATKINKVLLVSQAPATANPQPRHGSPLDATAVTSNITAA
ncbi:hypothetical protein [Nostoc sp. CALU 546]|uniref:hypothetical protein n=1 Tax=Nostoc sp. CALU 546 TaxID=1867241 RepID=UPI003B674A0C